MLCVELPAAYAILRHKAAAGSGGNGYGLRVFCEAIRGRLPGLLRLPAHPLQSGGLPRASRWCGSSCRSLPKRHQRHPRARGQRHQLSERLGKQFIAENKTWRRRHRRLGHGGEIAARRLHAAGRARSRTRSFRRCTSCSYDSLEGLYADRAVRLEPRMRWRSTRTCRNDAEGVRRARQREARRHPVRLRRRRRLAAFPAWSCSSSSPASTCCTCRSAARGARDHRCRRRPHQGEIMATASATLSPHRGAASFRVLRGQRQDAQPRAAGRCRPWMRRVCPATKPATGLGHRTGRHAAGDHRPVEQGDFRNPGQHRLHAEARCRRRRCREIHAGRIRGFTERELEKWNSGG